MNTRHEWSILFVALQSNMHRRSDLETFYKRHELQRNSTRGIGHTGCGCPRKRCRGPSGTLRTKTTTTCSHRTQTERWCIGIPNRSKQMLFRRHRSDQPTALIDLMKSNFVFAWIPRKKEEKEGIFFLNRTSFNSCYSNFRETVAEFPRLVSVLHCFPRFRLLLFPQVFLFSSFSWLLK